MVVDEGLNPLNYAGLAAGTFATKVRYVGLLDNADDVRYLSRVDGVVPTPTSILIDRYGTLSQSTLPGQAHHLNQTAAYGGVISRSEGMAIKLEGNVLRDVGAPHTLAHESLETFWGQYRGTGIRPTNLQYTQAMQQSLRAASTTALS
jgi:hypothetical protein